MNEKNKIKLDQLDKKLPFTLPENYFEQFAENMQAQLTTEPTNTISFYHRMRPYLFAAAIFIGIVLTAIPIYQNIQNKANLAMDEEFRTYVMTEVDEDTMIDYMATLEMSDE